MTEKIQPSDVVDDDLQDEPADESLEESGRSVRDMLLSTDAPAETNVQMLQDQYGLSHGKALIVFGIIKASGAAGMPAIGDILTGLFLELQEADIGSSSSSSETEPSEPADPDSMPDIAQ